MKNLRIAALCACFGFISNCVFSQKANSLINEPNLNKPKLFTHLPEDITVDPDNIEILFGNKTGKTAALSISSGLFQLDGEVISQFKSPDNRQVSKTIRLPKYDNAIMTITKITNPQTNLVSFVGRIVNMKSADILELQNKNGHYFFVKRSYYDLINE